MTLTEVLLKHKKHNEACLNPFGEYINGTKRGGGGLKCNFSQRDMRTWASSKVIYSTVQLFQTLELWSAVEEKEVNGTATMLPDGISLEFKNLVSF
jgi:hypothetical protein